MEGIKTKALTAPFLCGDGEVRTIQWNTIRRSDGHGPSDEVILIGKDVTRRTHLETQNRVLLDTIPDGLFRVNDRHEVVEINRYATRMLGIRPEEVLGKKCYDTLCTCTKDACPVFAEDRDEDTFETDLPLKGGGSVHVLKSIRKYRLGKREFALESFKDITGLKRMEQKVRDYAENLERKVRQRTDQLQQVQSHLLQTEKLAAMGRLAASIAHEINSPIYGIRGCLESVLDEVDLPEDMAEFVALSVKETDRIAELIRSLQNLHRDTKGARREEDLGEILRDVMTLYGKFLSGKNIVAKLDLEPRLPLVRICADQIKQVIINLLNNAVESMPGGGILTLTTRLEDDHIKIRVKDTGQGMTREVQDRIFDAFFTTKNAVKGVGLGLPVCWGLVRDHGGRITTKSEPGKGAEFVVSLPVVSDAGTGTRDHSLDI